MKIRKSYLDDLPQIMQIIDQAKESLKRDGVNQWQDGYPNQETIKKDISDACSYVVVSNDVVVATFMLAGGPDASYSNIYEGAWINNERNYYVLHRIAVDQDYKHQGVAKFIIESIVREKLNPEFVSLRIDTHKDNFRMRRLLQSLGFSYCGVIKLDSHELREAFELKKEHIYV